MAKIYNDDTTSFTPYSLSVKDSEPMTYYFGDIDLDPPTIQLPDDGVIKLGDDFTISAKELKACLKVLRDIAKIKYPEDYV